VRLRESPSGPASVARALAGGDRTACPPATGRRPLDQLVVARGLLGAQGLRLEPENVQIVKSLDVATPSGRPRNFDRKKLKGASDHLPLAWLLNV
jgi:hypothetical protein